MKKCLCGGKAKIVNVRYGEFWCLHYVTCEVCHRSHKAYSTKEEAIKEWDKTH